MAKDVYDASEEIIWVARQSTRPAWVWGIFLLWLPLLFAYPRKWGSQYTLTNERLTVSRGIIRKHIDEIELYRITDTKAKQSFAQRLLGIGDLYVGSDDQTGNLLLKGVSKPKSKREQLRALVNKSRKEHNVRIVTS